MKVCFKYVKKSFNDEQFDILKKFIKFIHQEIPLKKDIMIAFLDKKTEKMTTGSRLPYHKIKVLTKNRLFIDILRTVSHEWVHEYQHQKLGLKEKSKVKDIGGPEENMANVLSGIFIKKFQKEYPEYKKVLYGEE